MVWQPKRPSAQFSGYIAKVVAIAGVVLVLILGQRKVISEDFVVYGIVAAVALFAGYMMLSHLD